MFTKQRLDKVYERALRVPIDQNTKIVFMSDCHRGDNSLADEFAKNQTIYYYALNYYYDNEYTYIELGDGDEVWEHKHFSHIRYAHSDVFMTMKKFYKASRLYLLFGNHNIRYSKKFWVRRDLEKFYDEYEEEDAELFPGIKIHEGLVLEYKEKDQEIFCLHGHQGDFWNDQVYIINRFLMRYFWRFMHIVGFTNPASPAKNVHKVHKIEKSIGKWIKERKIMTIIGHTHRPKFPKNGELPYFNDGCCVHPRNITAIEIANGEIMLVSWKIQPHDSGILYTDRTVIRGPEKLEKFKL